MKLSYIWSKDIELQNIIINFIQSFKDPTFILPTFCEMDFQQYIQNT